MDEKEKDALIIATKNPVRGMTAKQAADFILHARESDFFFRAAGWSTWPPLQIFPGDRPAFASCMEFIKFVLERGFIPGKGWWHLEDVADLGKHLALLIDVTLALRELRRTGEIKGTRDFETFTDLLCGPDWEKSFRRLKRELRKKPQGVSDVGISR